MTSSALQTHRLEVAVVMERERAPNVWEDWRFRVVEVVPQQPGFGQAARLLVDDGRWARWLHPGFVVELFRDEAEGYHLNLSSGQPMWFVMWRLHADDASQACPAAVSLSYNEAGRWLDAQERVDGMPLPPEVAAWLQAYTDEHYRPEPKKRQRPVSFLGPSRREPGAHDG
ncbi:MAG: hypothetical protein KatS3mg122_2799 [Caldimonas sp.]|uniref:DUF3305 domain-containing protein n=1 Tax=Caldimonas taiwanensis TaxID=307483 RepID=UPI000783C303|nr:DUF3305 domain-containing protein [Caldimonas taiwanensis]GIX25568.1 MAG: hypothetical protein KatS3mg122_2799 [Caldimonas sp.]